MDTTQGITEAFDKRLRAHRHACAIQHMYFEITRKVIASIYQRSVPQHENNNSRQSTSHKL